MVGNGVAQSERWRAVGMQVDATVLLCVVPGFAKRRTKCAVWRQHSVASADRARDDRVFHHAAYALCGGARRRGEATGWTSVRGWSLQLGAVCAPQGGDGGTEHHIHARTHNASATRANALNRPAPRPRDRATARRRPVPDKQVSAVDKAAWGLGGVGAVWTGGGEAVMT